MNHLLVVTTAPSDQLAGELAATSVANKLAACAQVEGPIVSTYRWQGNVESSTEWRVVFKTTLEKYPQLEEHIKANHPYETPEIITSPISGNAEYLAWITESSGPRG